jgi:hypothetical protein
MDDIRFDTRIILRWTLKKYCGRMWTRFSWLRIHSIEGSFENSK